MRGPGSSGKPYPARVPGVLIAGTTSDAGKSFVATGLCRLLARRGWRVAPFKAANMSLNAVAADDGGEMASAQWVQCRAARFPPLTVCNPILYKSEGSVGVEVIVRGQVRWRTASWARTMPRIVPKLRREVRRALDELRTFDVFVVAEGAGSPAEVNLRKTDLSNLDVASALGAPALLVADLERGGTIAQIVGTLALLSASERRQIRGILFNRMAGNPRLLRTGIQFVERRTGIPVVGVLPYLPSDAGHLPAEDVLSLVRYPASARSEGATSGDRLVRVGILRLPHVSNFSDFSLLENSPSAEVTWVTDPGALPDLDVLVLPGTRRTVDDLDWLRKSSWPAALRRFLQRNLRIAGFCGGYQILGDRLVDPRGFEGRPGTTRGLQMLPLVTTFRAPKLVRAVRAMPELDNPWCPPGADPEGFEIRRGRTVVGYPARPLFRLHCGNDGPGSSESDGAILPGGKVWGTAVHGLLNDSRACEGFLRWAAGRPNRCRKGPLVPIRAPTADPLETTIERVADLLEENLNMARLSAILGTKLTRRSTGRRTRG